jgi:hypothetical protein
VDNDIQAAPPEGQLGKGAHLGRLIARMALATDKVLLRLCQARIPRSGEAVADGMMQLVTLGAREQCL